MFSTEQKKYWVSISLRSDLYSSACTNNLPSPSPTTQHLSHLSIPREEHRADFSPIMAFGEGLHTSAWHPIPDLDVPVFGGTGTHTGISRVAHTGERSWVVLPRVGTNIALACIDVIEPYHRSLSGDGQEVTTRVDGHASHLLCILQLRRLWCTDIWKLGQMNG